MTRGGIESPSRVAGTAAPGCALLGGALVVFGTTFLFRFLTTDFPNDHFVHLSRARQILLGEVPVRDFFDPGLFLQYYASAAALALSGGTLYGEAVLTAGLIAFGTTVTFLVATRVAASTTIGLGAAVVAAATVPRLYNYPKVFLYVLALACAWRYIRRPGPWGTAILALVTVLAFLFRHDHGVYIGLALTACLVVFHWGEPGRAAGALARYFVIALLLVLPWATFVQSTAGLWNYFRGSVPQARDATTPRFIWLPLGVASPSTWFAVDPPPERRIRVRWASQADAGIRREREARHGLTQAVADDPQTSSYVLASEQPDRIRALVEDPMIEDTHGLDRATHRLAVSETLYERLRRQVPFLRLRVSDGILTTESAVAWLYYLTMILPVACIVLLLAGGWRGRISRPEAAVMTAAALLCLVIDQGLVRDFPRARLPDVAAPTAVLGAWIAGLWIGRAPASRSRSAVLRPAVAAAIWLATVWSAGTVGRAGELLDASGLVSNPLGTPGRLAGVAAQLRRRPIDVWTEASETGIHALTRYVLDCTAPTDRLLVTWFEPEVFFYAERPFAGGQVYLYGGWHASVQDQRLTVERLERERVPVVLVNSALATHPVAREFPLVYDYVREHYTVAAEGTFGSDQVFSVLTDGRVRPTGTYRRFDLPCYR